MGSEPLPLLFFGIRDGIPDTGERFEPSGLAMKFGEQAEAAQNAFEHST